MAADIQHEKPHLVDVHAVDVEDVPSGALARIEPPGHPQIGDGVIPLGKQAALNGRRCLEVFVDLRLPALQFDPLPFDVRHVVNKEASRRRP